MIRHRERSATTTRLGVALLAAALAMPAPALAESPPSPSPVVQIPAGNDVTAGTPADAAYGGSGSATLVAALKGVYAALQALGTAANQQTEIANLGTIAGRLTSFNDLANGTVAASGSYQGTIRNAGAAYTRFNGMFFANQAGTVQIAECPDSACSSSFLVASASISANAYATVSAVLYAPYARVQFQNGSATNAAALYVASSFTAN